MLLQYSIIGLSFIALVSAAPTTYCNADNCLRALRATTRPASQDCSSFLAIPTVTYTETITFSETDTDTLSLTETATIPVTLTTAVTATDTVSVTVTGTLTITQNLPALQKRQVQIPAYASACSGAVRYSSACSCIGIQAPTITPSVTVTVSTTLSYSVTQTVVDTTSLTTTDATLTNTLDETATVTVGAEATETVVTFRLMAKRPNGGGDYGLINIGNVLDGQYLFFPGTEPAVFHIASNGELRVGNNNVRGYAIAPATGQLFPVGSPDPPNFGKWLCSRDLVTQRVSCSCGSRNITGRTNNYPQIVNEGDLTVSNRERLEYYAIP